MSDGTEMSPSAPAPEVSQDALVAQVTSFAPTITGDPAGDVLITLGFSPGATTVRGSAAVLSHASPVFRAMLGPAWADPDAEPRSASSPKETWLKEIDTDAMTWILTVLHEQEPAGDVSLELLGEIAVLVDYYQLGSSAMMKGWGGLVLSEAEDRAAVDQDWVRIMSCALIFGHHRSFYRSSLRILTHCEAASIDIDEDGPGNPARLDWGSIGMFLIHTLTMKGKY